MKKVINKPMVILKAGVIVRNRGRILLIKEQNHRTLEYKWNIIKGTFEPGRDSSIMATAVREALEEANANIKLKYLLAVFYLLDKQDALMMFTFIADLLDSKVQALPQEIQAIYGTDKVSDVRFFTKQELSKLKPKDFIGLRGYFAVQEYLKGIKFPLSIIKTLLPK